MYVERAQRGGGYASLGVGLWQGPTLTSVGKAPCQLTDVMPTIVEATGANYPAQYNGRTIMPFEGRSLLPALRGKSSPDGALYWEHTGNAAIRRGQWKMVREYPNAWELYDMSRDRSELNNLAAEHSDVVKSLTTEWETWASRVGVLPWETTLDIYRQAGKTDMEAAG